MSFPRLLLILCPLPWHQEPSTPKSPAPDRTLAVYVAVFNHAFPAAEESSGTGVRKAPPLNGDARGVPLEALVSEAVITVGAREDWIRVRVTGIFLNGIFGMAQVSPVLNEPSNNPRAARVGLLTLAIETGEIRPRLGVRRVKGNLIVTGESYVEQRSFSRMDGGRTVRPRGSRGYILSSLLLV